MCFDWNSGLVKTNKTNRVHTKVWSIICQNPFPKIKRYINNELGLLAKSVVQKGKGTRVFPPVTNGSGFQLPASISTGWSFPRGGNHFAKCGAAVVWIFFFFKKRPTGVWTGKAGKVSPWNFIVCQWIVYFLSAISRKSEELVISWMNLEHPPVGQVKHPRASELTGNYRLGKSDTVTQQWPHCPQSYRCTDLLRTRHPLGSWCFLL